VVSSFVFPPCKAWSAEARLLLLRPKDTPPKGQPTHRLLRRFGFLSVRCRPSFPPGRHRPPALVSYWPFDCVPVPDSVVLEQNPSFPPTGGGRMPPWYLRAGRSALCFPGCSIRLAGPFRTLHLIGRCFAAWAPFSFFFMLFPPSFSTGVRAVGVPQLFFFFYASSRWHFPPPNFALALCFFRGRGNTPVRVVLQ